MDDLEAVANLNVIIWLLPLSIAAGLAAASVWRAIRTRDEPRVYATAAAICLGAFTVSLLIYPVGYVILAILAIIGLGTWAASLIRAPAWLLLAEAATLPLAFLAVILLA